MTIKKTKKHLRLANGQPQNLTQLRESMSGAYYAAANGDASLERVTVMANIAGKIIKSATAQVEYAQARKEKPDVPYFK
jgi:hypothetical protein